jgi:hypothetical protein
MKSPGGDRAQADAAMSRAGDRNLPFFTLQFVALSPQFQ